MKKIENCFLFLVLFLLYFELYVNAEPIEIMTYGDLSYEFNSNGTEVIITDCNTVVIEMIISDNIENIPVTAIGKNAFSGCKTLSSIC